MKAGEFNVLKFLKDKQIMRWHSNLALITVLFVYLDKTKLFTMSQVCKTSSWPVSHPKTRPVSHPKNIINGRH